MAFVGTAQAVRSSRPARRFRRCRSGPTYDHGVRRLVLALAFVSVAALGACSTPAEPTVNESAATTPGPAGDDVDYLTCRPHCSNENFYRLDLSNTDRSASTSTDRVCSLRGARSLRMCP